MRNETVVARLRAQYGVIARQQALEDGMTAGQIRHCLANGEWMSEVRGVYRHAVIPRSWSTILMVAVLATGGVASHRSAARLHRLRDAWSSTPEVTVRHGRWRTVPDAVVHQSTQIDKLDVVVLDSLPATGLARTVLDLGASMGPKVLGDRVDQLVVEKRLAYTDLWDTLVRHSRRGRNGCGALRSVLETRRGAREVALSTWSYMVGRLLVSAGLPEPRLEFRVHSPSGVFLAQVDLAYPSKRLAIELDSVSFHHNLTSFQRDRGRSRALTVAGWSVLQFTWQDYTDRPNQLITQVETILRQVGAA